MEKFKFNLKIFAIIVAITRITVAQNVTIRNATSDMILVNVSGDRTYQLNAESTQNFALDDIISNSTDGIININFEAPNAIQFFYRGEASLREPFRITIAKRHIGSRTMYTAFVPNTVMIGNTSDATVLLHGNNNRVIYLEPNMVNTIPIAEIATFDGSLRILNFESREGIRFTYSFQVNEDSPIQLLIFKNVIENRINYYVQGF